MLVTVVFYFSIDTGNAATIVTENTTTTSSDLKPNDDNALENRIRARGPIQQHFDIPLVSFETGVQRQWKVSRLTNSGSLMLRHFWNQRLYESHDRTFFLIFVSRQVLNASNSRSQMTVGLGFKCHKNIEKMHLWPKTLKIPPKNGRK